MAIYYEILGGDSQSTPLITLHGLFGSWDNLGVVAKSLAASRKVYALDLPNHGRSAHTTKISYPQLAATICQWMDERDLHTINLVGHSMGGKVAMAIALTHPNRVKKLCVIDIAPKRYSPSHQAIFQAMHDIVTANPSTRSEADKLMQRYVEDSTVRSFLLKNWVRQDNGFAWRHNLSTLESHYDDILDWPIEGRFEGDTLFIKGGLSPYISHEDQPLIAAQFPNAKAKIIEGTEHWPHAQKPALTVGIIERFLA
ncbi:MAG: alpha/beta fold hydrolase [Gammaproteobacteria bacterium]|nr:alpha/beta fold hydrolase [Gammaproteobacteria bacterium]